MSEHWFGAVVDHLAMLRAREGPDFPRHWRMTMVLYPPRGRIADAPLQLFDEAGERPVTLLAFFRRSCESAYYGERGEKGSGVGPALAHFRPEMLTGADETGSARHAPRDGRRFRTAA